MNQTRSFLLIAWLVVAAMLWMEWNKHPDQTLSAPSAPTTGSAPAPGASLPASAVSASALPPAALTVPTLPGTSGTSGAIAPITLQNDVLKLTVDLHGGRVIGSQLLDYTREKKPGSPKIELLSSEPARYFVAVSGLLQVDGQQQQDVLDTDFRTADGRRSYALTPGGATLSVPLHWTDPKTGLTVRRTLTLTRGSYVLDQSEQVGNPGTLAQRVYPFVEFERVAPPPPPKHKGLTNPETFSFTGAAWYSPEDKFEKVAFDDFAESAPLNKTVTGGWIAMLQHHFVTAWVPATDEPQVFSLRNDQRDGMPLHHLRSVAQPIDLAGNTSQTRESRLWVGPKLQAPLAQLALSLDLSVDYGVLTVLAQPLFWLLSALHKLLGNWGWAIIAIVVILKLCLYPLSAAQYRSMAKMRSVQPRIEALKERYGDDRQQFQMAMMELYKKEKINPVGGCLPMLIPMPIFFALYWVLIETVELRQASWMGWIHSLTDPDPYFILPVLNLVVMYLTQLMTPTPGMDPMQKKMMQFMPLVFGVMMAFFPAGLVLYWVTNGLLGLLQQWWMGRQHGASKLAVAR
jgi:YidC/Oxa1 family membrane protein insertase